MTVLGRPREFDRDHALQAAMLVFWSKGYSATSMNDLCDAMGIRSPSLYAAFRSKEALYLETIDYNAKTVGLPSIWAHLTAGPSARVCIENVLLAAADNLAANDVTPAGCMPTLALGEACPGAISDTVKSVRRMLLDMLRLRLQEAVRSGELTSTIDLDSLSRFYLGVYQGISAQARDGASSSALRGVATTAMAAWPAKKAPSRQIPLAKRKSKGLKNKE